MLNFLVLSWALSFGYVPEQLDAVQGNIVRLDQSRFASFVTAEIGLTAWDRVHVYGSIETFQYLSKGGPLFNPYRADYIAGADVYLTDWLTAGIVHECDHPIVSGMSVPSGPFFSRYNYLKSETKMFLRIGSKR